MRPEHVIEDYLVRMAHSCGCLCRKVAWPGRRGAPDRLVIFPDGEIVWVELKTPSGAVEALQEREHRILRRYKQNVKVIRTKTEIDNLFKEMET